MRFVVRAREETPQQLKEVRQFVVAKMALAEQGAAAAASVTASSSSFSAAPAVAVVAAAVKAEEVAQSICQELRASHPGLQNTAHLEEIVLFHVHISSVKDDLPSKSPADLPSASITARLEFS